MSASSMECCHTPSSLDRTYLLFLWETLIPIGGVPCASVILASKSSAAGGDVRAAWCGLSSGLYPSARRSSHFPYLRENALFRRKICTVCSEQIDTEWLSAMATFPSSRSRTTSLVLPLWSEEWTGG